MKIAVVGGAGYVGYWAARRLALEHEVTVWDPLAHGWAGSAGRGLKHFYCAPVVRAPIPHALGDDPDIIVYAAGVVGEDACKAEQHRAQIANVQLPKELAEHHGPRLLYLSTCSVYGRQDGICNEATPPAPVGLYGEQKLAGEQHVLAAGGTVLRFGTAFGWSPRMRWELLVNEIATATQVNLYEPAAVRPFIHVRDMAEAVAAAIRAGINGLYVVPARNVSKADIIDMKRRQVGPTDVHVSGAGDPRSYRADGSRFTAATGFSPRRKIGAGLLECATAWEIEQCRG